MRFGAILCKAIFVIGNDNFPWFKFRKLLTLRRGRSCAGPQVMFDIFLKEVGTLFVGRTRPAPAFGRLGWRVIISLWNLNMLFCMVVYGCLDGDNPHPYTGLCGSIGWFLYWFMQFDSWNSTVVEGHCIENWRYPLLEGKEWKTPVCAGNAGTDWGTREWESQQLLMCVVFGNRRRA